MVTKSTNLCAICKKTDRGSYERLYKGKKLDSLSYGIPAPGVTVTTITKYNILGYVDVFACDACIRKSRMGYVYGSLTILGCILLLSIFYG
jgi:hypothetical protein